MRRLNGISLGTLGNIGDRRTLWIAEKCFQLLPDLRRLRWALHRPPSSGVMAHVLPSSILVRSARLETVVQRILPRSSAPSTLAQRPVEALCIWSPGTYLCGTVVLKSNVTLYLEAGAVLLGSGDINDYQPKHLVYASGAENVGLAGPGKIDGQGSAFLGTR